MDGAQCETKAGRGIRGGVMVQRTNHISLSGELDACSIFHRRDRKRDNETVQPGPFWKEM